MSAFFFVHFVRFVVKFLAFSGDVEAAESIAYETPATLRGCFPRSIGEEVINRRSGLAG
jgi:hypothetical protein